MIDAAGTDNRQAAIGMTSRLSVPDCRLPVVGSRRARLREAAARTYDVIIVGGGINGAGIARDAAERGLRVLLIDKHDWGFGTTWRSTKLIHGGLRYLEHGEIGLVFESLRDRAVLLRTAPHLVRPLPFLLPVYRGDRHHPVLLDLGLTIYDVLALGGGLGRHHRLSVADALCAEPALRRDGLRAAFAYWDSQVALPERLCVENVLRAADAGAVTLTYTRADHLLAVDGKTAGIAATDERSGDTVEFRAPLVVNAAGPWVDALLQGSHLPADRIGGTRGAHLVLQFPEGGPRRPIYAEAPGDHRPFFIIPWRGVHLVGTTDIRVEHPDDTRPTPAEIEYLIEATDRLVPGATVSRADIWYAYGGIRPLPRTVDDREGAITRRHLIVDHAGDGLAGLLSVVGGKLSTYRTLAEQVTDTLFRRLDRHGPRSRTAREALVPGAWRPAAGDQLAAHLYRIYGPAGQAIATAAHADPALRRPLCPHTLDILAQVDHAVRREGASTIADVLLRRTPAGWAKCRGLDAAPLVAARMQSLLSWSDEAVQVEVQAYACEVDRTFVGM